MATQAPHMCILFR